MNRIERWLSRAVLIGACWVAGCYLVVLCKRIGVLP